MWMYYRAIIFKRISILSVDFSLTISTPNDVKFRQKALLYLLLGTLEWKLVAPGGV